MYCVCVWAARRRRDELRLAHEAATAELTARRARLRAAEAKRASDRTAYQAALEAARVQRDCILRSLNASVSPRPISRSPKRRHSRRGVPAVDDARTPRRNICGRQALSGHRAARYENPGTIHVPKKPWVCPLLSTYSPTISPESLMPKARVCCAPGKSKVSTPRDCVCTKP